MTRRKRSRSRKETDKKKSNEKSRQIRIVKEKRDTTPREIARRKRQRRERERLYRRRRIGVGIAICLLILIPSFIIFKKLNSYGQMGYPSFRDEVLEDLSTTSFVSSTEGRSLTSAEKNSDFDILYNNIIKNFAVDNSNREAFEEFTQKSDEYRKKITSSKTDQDFFLILGEYLGLLNDSYTKIMDKDSYDDLFYYYKDKNPSYTKNVLENPQAVNRYKRIIKDKNNAEASVGVENGSVLRVSLPYFKIKDLDKTIDEIIKAVTSAPGISTMIIDLSDNNSLNNIFVNEFSKYFIHTDYKKEDIIFYRGNLLANDLKEIKESESSPYQTALVKNKSGKYKEEVQNFNLDDYLYYDQVGLEIKKDPTFASRNIYILTNENTANEAIKLAAIFKETSNAYTVKNALDSNPTIEDRIYEFRPSFFVLDHSGLVISVNTSRAKGENRYLEYNQRINSKYPISSMLSIIG